MKYEETNDVDCLVRRFERFTAAVPSDFRDRMVEFWMRDEGYGTPDEALSVYGGPEFDALCEKLNGKTTEFEPDLGYTDSNVNGTLCFAVVDGDFVIPVSIFDA